MMGPKCNNCKSFYSIFTFCKFNQPQCKNRINSITNFLSMITNLDAQFRYWYWSIKAVKLPFKIFLLLSASKPKCNFGYWSKMTLKLSSYLSPKFSRVPLTIVLIRGISTMVNGTLLNFGKRYEDNLRVIFDQWPKLHLGLDALRHQKILNG